MENKVKSIMLLLLIVVCDSSCPSTWYAIPGNRCIKVYVGQTDLFNIPGTEPCAKFSDDTRVSTFFPVTDENYNVTKSLLLNLVPWSSLYYLDWSTDGTNIFDSDGNGVYLNIGNLDTAAMNCVVVDMTTDTVNAYCDDTVISYVCEMKPCGY
ncbi:uncharacterized protein LOC117120611 [Anneissia japonica]|uniref:uncharacterized protein LOC117120611 n=1 Tax=Anneissia japonica TaxID=1529436 RepID=UPI00142586D0|nr:uncharacterized protein LOC117120611 [Anneissia japonica]